MARGNGSTVRLHGKTFYVLFRHPALKRVIHKSLKTADANLAERYKQKLDAVLNAPERWNDLPDDFPQILRDIWGQKLTTVKIQGVGDIKYPQFNPWPKVIKPEDFDYPAIADSKDKVLSMINKGIMVQMASLAKEVERLTKVEKAQSADLESAKGTIQRQANQIQEITRERNYWKGKRLSRNECGTLSQEEKRYLDVFEKRKGDREYAKDVSLVIKRFVREMGSQKNVADVDEHAVAEWLLLYKSPDGNPIGETRRKFVRTAVLKFLSSATKNSFDRAAVPVVSTHSIRREQKEIMWLERPDAERLVASMYKLHGDYWGDAARVQLDQGWRPEELPMLRSDLTTEKTITLDVIEGEAPKTGKRTIQIPSTTLAAVQRRLAEGSPVLFPRRGLKEKARKPLISRVGPIHVAMWYPTSFDKVYSQLLRSAAEDAGISKTIDCRILRRSFGSLQLRAGKRDVEVAALMGDRPETIRRHYARILAEEVGIELAPHMPATEPIAKRSDRRCASKKKNITAHKRSR